MKPYRMIICLLIVSGALLAQDALNGYLRLAAESNPSLKAKFNEYMAAMEQLPQVSALPDPQVVFAYFILPVETRNGPQRARISLTQMFPWFGTLGAKKNLAQEMARAQYEQFEEAKSTLFFEVKSAYLDLYMIKRSITKTSETVHILETFRNLALIKISSGSTSAVDELKAEMELGEMENMLALLTDQERVLIVRFNTLLNCPADTPIELPEVLSTTDLHLSKQDILDAIKQKNHQLKSLDHVIEAYRNKGYLARKSGMPGFTLGLDYLVIGKNDNTMIDAAQNGHDAIIFPMVGMTIPLQRGKYRAMVREAALLQEATSQKKLDKTNALSVLLEKVLSQYHDAVRRMALFEKQGILTQKALSILEVDYATDGKNFEDILRMTNKQLKYALELEKARADKQAAIAYVDSLLGR